MKLEIDQDGVTTVLDLRDGIFTFGGAETDAVRIPGAPAAVLAARIDPRQVVVESDETLEFDGVLSPRGVPRLWLATEVVRLPGGARLRQLPEPAAKRADATVALLQGLAGDLDAVEGSVPELICLTGLDLGRAFPVVDGETELGRGSGPAIRIRDRAVSRRHARVLRESGAVRVEDLGSPNGTYVNGRRARGRTALYDGDVIELGRSLLKLRATGAIRPVDVAEPPAEPNPAPVKRARASEWLVVFAGALLALLGAAMTWRFVA